jgi:thiamine transport system ATP-binding protein
VTVLELDGVAKRFGDTVALDDVDLSVERGEFFTLVGPSGCGKTTTLRIVAGLDDPTAGTVRIAGEDVAGVDPDDRDVGVVFQSYALFPHMTVAENVGYGLRFADPPGGRSRAERVSHLLELVDLPDAGDRAPGELSGGQQQRVALARALAPGPSLLLLDEPMSALDARLRERLRLQVREIQDELGITTLYVTHDQEEALAVSDRVAVLNGGRVEQVADPETVYRHPESRFVAEFVGDNNVFGVDDVSDAPDETEGSAAVVDGVTVAVSEAVAAGDAVCVRPEHCAFGGGDTALSVSVERAEFLGEAYRAHCDWRGRDLLVRTAERPPTGEATVGFDADDVRVVRR